MLEHSKTLKHETRFTTTLLSILLTITLAFCGVPASAWADTVGAQSDIAQEVQRTQQSEDHTFGGFVNNQDPEAMEDSEAVQNNSEDSSEETDDSDQGSMGEDAVNDLGQDVENISVFYIDKKEITLGEEQNILVSFNEIVSADSFRLQYQKNGSSDLIAVDDYRLSIADGETSVLFSFVFSNASDFGDYRILGMSWSGAEEGHFEAPVGDDGISFTVMEPVECDEGITITSLDEDGSVVERVQISDALEVADEAIAAAAAPQISAFANSRVLMNNPVIGLDPGHGGTDSGAVGGGVLEKDLNLRIALACRDRLRQQGARVVMTREDDRLLSVNQIAQIARDKGATVLVSFHINSATSASATGYEVWVQNDHYRPDLSQESNALGQKVLDKLAQFGLDDRGLKDDEASGPAYAYPDGSAGDYLAVLRNGKKLGMPSILIEHGFISNSYDRNIMYQRAEEMGRADAEAIIEYYNIGGKLIDDGIGLRYQFGDGTFLRNAWQDWNGERYYFKDDGYAARYYNVIDGKTYCFWSNCTLIRNQIWKDNYFGPDGAMFTDGWFDLNGRRYYAHPSGQLAQYHTEIGNDSYLFWTDHSLARNQIWNHMHFDQNGVMSKGKWVDFNGRRYYAKADGQLAQYQNRIDGKDYLFWSDGSLVCNRWWDNRYYQADGSMATNQWIGELWVGADGLLDPDSSAKIMGQSKATAAQMAQAYIARVGADAYPYKGNTDAPNIQAFCEALVREANSEGVRADVVFAQSMHETNWLRFGGDVKKEQFNFAGIGATGGGNPGNSFSSIPTGILAQVQHLKAYASTDPLNRGCVDPRFKYVQRGCAPVILWLGIPDNPYGKGWAAQKGYGNYITNYMKYVEQF